MTTPVIQVYGDGFNTAPCMRTFDALSSTFTGGDDKYNSHYEWWTFYNGNLDATATSFEGPIYSYLCKSPGDYTVILRMKTESTDTSGAYLEERYNWSVSAATYNRDYFVDFTLGNNANPGTEASPFQTLQHAATQMFSNWGTGLEHRINLKRGETFNTSTSLNSYATVSGHLVVSSYGEGEKPIVSHTGSSNFLLFGGPFSMSVVDIATNGNRVGSKGSVFLFKFSDLNTTSLAVPARVLMNNVTCSSWDGLYTCTLNNMTSSHFYNGVTDNTFIENCDTHNIFSYSVIVTNVRNFAIVNNTYRSTTADSGNIRFNSLTRGYISKLSIPTICPHGTSIRIHGGNTSQNIFTNGVVIGKCNVKGYMNIVPYSSGNTHGYKDIWVQRNFIDLEAYSTSSPQNANCIKMAAGGPDKECVIANNIGFSRTGFCGNDSTVQESFYDIANFPPSGYNFYNNSHALANSVSTTVRFCTPGFTSGIRAYNNFSVAQDSTNAFTCAMYQISNNRPRSLVEASDRNIIATSGDRWAESSQGVDTLAVWRTQTGLDLSSYRLPRTDASNIVESLTSIEPSSLMIKNTSVAYENGIRNLPAYLDYRGRIRSKSTFDIGAYEYDATDTPSPPSLSSGGATTYIRSNRMFVGIGIGL